MVYIESRPEIHSSLIDSDVTEVHITWVYLGDVDFTRTVDIVSDWVKEVEFSPFKAEITGINNWIIPGGYVQVAAVSSMRGTLHHARENLAKFLGTDVVDTTYPFNPHITLKHTRTFPANNPILETKIPFVIDNLFVSKHNSKVRIV